MDPRPPGTPGFAAQADVPDETAAVIQAFSQNLTGTFAGLSAVTESGVLSLWSEGQLVSTLQVTTLLGAAPDAESVASTLWVVINTVQDDLVRDWGGQCLQHWPAALCSQVSTIAQATPEVGSRAAPDGSLHWHWSYRFPRPQARA